MRIDIRDEKTGPVTEIVATDNILLDHSTYSVYLENRHNAECVLIENKTDALNLIKALNKAIEFGWFE